jgi:hypothetical protein
MTGAEGRPVPGIFLSYARETASTVDALAADIGRLGYATWLDKDLHGGKAWWDQILAQIRDCHIFILALSPESVRSTACSREAAYAEALGKPILPIMVADGVGVLPARLSRIHYVDYRKQDRDALANLARALREMPPAGALPPTLPEPPAIPLSYLERIAEQLDGEAPLSGKDQSEIVSELRGGLHEPETAADARTLLKRLARRPELLARIGREIEELLGGTAAGSRKVDPTPAAQAASTPAGNPTSAPQDMVRGLRSSTSPDASPPPYGHRWLAGGAILLLWVIVSPLAIHGIMPAPNAVMIIPISTMLLAFLWPLQPGQAASLTFFMHLANLVLSFVTGTMWEKDQETGTLVLTIVAILNPVLVALISGMRLRRIGQHGT